jgi:hypothetical protein
MMADDLQDILGHVVATLPPIAPAAARTERVRALCRARLARDRRRSRRLASISRLGRHVVAPAIIAGLFLVYAVDLLSITLRTFTA